MPVQILSTKLSIPSVRSRVVIRSRLLHKLNQALECGFVLISAPAGYGKSTLLSSWINRTEHSTAWISLDDRDNDTSRFLAYLSTALRSIDPSIEDVLNSSISTNSKTEVEAF